jgi:hypothetical protein
MQVARTSWQEPPLQERERNDLRVIEIESFLRNADEKKLVPPLKEARAALAQRKDWNRTSGQKQLAAVAFQEQWDSWLAQRERLCEEIKRGKECLEQVRRDLVITRAQLEEWPAYEWHCGKNPLPEFIQSISISERIEQFLPGWLRRQQARLNQLNRDIEACARQRGLEHLL